EACTGILVEGSDQRGVDRLQNEACDIGAFEQGIIFLVTNTDDSGAGSLRQALLDANEHINAVGPDTIYFNIAGTGPHTISPASPLPVITDPILIDGTTQPGASCSTWPPTLQVELNGSAASGNG